MGAFAVVLALIGVLAVFALSQQGALYAEVQGGRTDDLLPTAAIADAQASVAGAHLATVEMAALDTADTPALVEQKRKAISFANDSIEKVYAGGIDPATRDAMDAFSAKWKAYETTLADVETLAVAGRSAEAAAAIAAAGSEYDAMLAPLAEANADLEQQSEAGFAAATATRDRARALTLVLLVAAAAAAVGLGLGVARLIARPARHLVDVLGRVAEGDLTVRSTYDAGDEIGVMSRALNRSLDALQDVFGQIAERGRALGTAAGELSRLAGDTSRNSSDTAQQATHVSAAAVQVSSSVQTIAAGTEEMTSTVNEVAQTAAQAAEIAAGAVQLAQSTSAVMDRLDRSSDEIVNVVTVITNIAEQTNLLALNATIEAARAGEAGRGFAVVANEVKDLARETATATEQIRAMVTGIQDETRSAVASIERISVVIEQISDGQASIASAVEEQAATTAEMSRTAADVATGATSIADTIGVVADAADANTRAAGASDSAARELAGMADHLLQLVGRYRY